MFICCGDGVCFCFALVILDSLLWICYYLVEVDDFRVTCVEYGLCMMFCWM